MISSCAYFLVFHGSRDSRTLAAASQLKQLLTTKYKFKNILTQQNYSNVNWLNCQIEVVANLSLSTSLIDVAALELAPRSLSESLIDFARQAQQQGITQIEVIPLFLAPGVHVRQDIPAEIDLAIKQIDRQITIKLSAYVGKYSGIVSLLSGNFAQLSEGARILVAHGSRLSGVANYYQNLARRLDADLAYWSIAPKITQKIEAKIASGEQKIAIQPYFLFPGRITSAIATEVARLQAQYPQVELHLGQPLGASALAQLIAST